jgi:hypothetical protein
MGGFSRRISQSGKSPQPSTPPFFASPDGSITLVVTKKMYIAKSSPNTLVAAISHAVVYYKVATYQARGKKT